MNYRHLDDQKRGFTTKTGYLAKVIARHELQYLLKLTPREREVARDTNLALGDYHSQTVDLVLVALANLTPGQETLLRSKFRIRREKP